MIKKNHLYLITGGTGLLGVTLCKNILEMGGQVRMVARNRDKLEKIKEKYPTIDIIVGDISNKKLFETCLLNVEGIFHLAALAKGLQGGGTVESVNTNLVGTINLLEESQKYPIKFILGISSDKAVQISSVYGATKFINEKLFEEFETNNKNTDYRVVRLSNVLYSVDSVLDRWKKLIQEGRKVTVTDLNATRFFITPQQAIDVMFQCLKHSKNSQPYYIKSKATSIKILLQAMYLKYGKRDFNIKNVNIIGLQKGENMHEKIAENELPSNQAQFYTLNELINIL